MASLEDLTTRLQLALAGGSSLDKTIKLDLKGEGFIHVDGQAVTNKDLPADLTVRVSRKDLEALGKGQLNPMTATITGRLQISDMGLAMSLMPQVQDLFAKLS